MTLVDIWARVTDAWYWLIHADLRIGAAILGWIILASLAMRPLGSIFKRIGAAVTAADERHPGFRRMLYFFILLGWSIFIVVLVHLIVVQGRWQNF